MRVLCFIDSLGSGGAQRQIVMLARGLKRRGHEVRVLVFHQQDHFLPLLQSEGIHCQVIPPCSYCRRALAVRRILRPGWQEVVLAFLEAPCFYAELARFPTQRWGLVVGERSANPSMKLTVGRWLRQFHRLADAVVANSHTNHLMLQSLFPFLRAKLCTIYNTVDLQLFRPSLPDRLAVEISTPTDLRIVVAASYQFLKNIMGVAKALLLVQTNLGAPKIVVDWYGGMPAGSTAFEEAQTFIEGNGLTGTLNLHPLSQQIVKEFASASAVGLFSFFEGLPNVVCEAMACGKPILLSDVCDAGNLVQDGRNGFLCDPSSPASMADAFKRLGSMGDARLRQMGLESRRMAEELFAEDAIIGRYEAILQSAAEGHPIPADCTFPSEVPASAIRTVEAWATGSAVTPASRQ